MEIYIGQILYGFSNNKFLVKKIVGENLHLENEREITITYNAGLEKRIERKKEIVHLKKTDIGIKIFLKKDDYKKEYNELLNDFTYEKYKENIIKYNEYIENEKKIEIEKNAPGNLMTTKEKDFKLIQYEDKDFSQKEEEEFHKHAGAHYFARLDVEVEYYGKSYFGGKYYISKDTVFEKRKMGAFLRDGEYYTYEDLMNMDLDRLCSIEYIEKGLTKKYDDETNLIHWTAPLANLYYDKTNNCWENGLYRNKAMLKRNFSFYPLKYVNTYIMNNSFYAEGTVDEFLLEILKEKRNSNELTDIIYTIQSNQNKIIRASKDKNFIVQGCAGSGKTMILLHRLSYLKFNNLLPEYSKIKIITPNKLFSNFIKQLSFDLEIDEIEQLTMSNYYYYLNNLYINNYDILNLNIVGKNEYIKFIKKVKDKFKSRFKIKFSSEKMIDENTLDKNWIKKIYSKETIDLIEKEYLNIIEYFKNKFKNLNIEIEDNQYTNKQFFERVIIEIFKKIENIKNKKKSNINKINSIIDEIERLNIAKSKKNNIFFRLFGSNEERKIEELLELKNKLEKEQDIILAKEIELTELIKEVIEESYFSISVFLKVFENISFDNENRIPKDKFIIFELIAFLFVNYLHSGKLINSDKLICVDEAQDYSEIEYEIIKKVNGKNLKINLYGDINQSFYSKGITTWENLCKNQMFEYYELNENYRNSIEITKFTNKKLNYNILPMGISGKEVSAIKIEDIFNLIQEKQKNGKKIVILLSKDEEKKLFNEIDDIYFCTVEKVKGIEYDTVIVYGTNMSNTEKYISYTRALNELYIII